MDCDNCAKMTKFDRGSADHLNGEFIPNWALWLILEVEEFLQRSGDRAFVDAMRSRLEGIVAYLDDFSDEDGLLRELRSWVFIEWSVANNLTQDLNYPSNMLWEHDGTLASCNHGFASHVAFMLYRDVLGVKEVDVRNRRVRVEPPAGTGLGWCEGTFPVGESESVFVRWEKGRKPIVEWREKTSLHE